MESSTMCLEVPGRAMVSDRWRKALQFGALHQIKLLVVDKVHTVATW